MMFHGLRDALISKKCSFFEHCSNGGGVNPCSKILSEIVVRSGGHLTTWNLHEKDSCGGFSNSSTIDAERHIRHGMQLIKVVHSFFIPRSRQGHKRSGLPNWLQMFLWHQWEWSTLRDAFQEPEGAQQAQGRCKAHQEEEGWWRRGGWEQRGRGCGRVGNCAGYLFYFSIISMHLNLNFVKQL